MANKAAAKSAAKKRTKAKNKAPQKQNEIDEMLQQFVSLMQAGGVSASDMDAVGSSLGGPSPYDRFSDAEADAKSKAQQIAFEAMEAENDAQARKLAKRALRLDPDCVDALVVLVDLDAHTQRARIEGLQAAVAAGERTMGEAFTREHKGEFWLLIETRPYMRAMEQLAREMAELGMYIDAIGFYEKMLELNPNDNQGVRDPLLGLYLAVSDLAGAGKLLKRYKGDASANFAWGRVIERHLAGDLEGATAMLSKAIKNNRFLAEYLTGRKPLPRACRPCIRPAVRRRQCSAWTLWPRPGQRSRRRSSGSMTGARRWERRPCQPKPTLERSFAEECSRHPANLHLDEAEMWGTRLDMRGTDVGTRRDVSPAPVLSPLHATEDCLVYRYGPLLRDDHH